jgi:hypothetical protein
MKRRMAFAAVLAFAALGTWLVVGCNPPREVVGPNDLQRLRAGADTLVVVYSRSGNTARAARAIAEVLEADYLRLQGPGDEGDSFCRTPSWRDRVELRPGSVDLVKYRRIVIATPIWYWRPSAFVMQFVEDHDLRGKDVALFYTYEGGLSDGGIDGWKEQVVKRGGRVVFVGGIDRDDLSDDGLEARARELGNALAVRWRQPKAPQAASAAGF